MALDLFRIRKGLSIDDNVNIYEGNGQPSGDALTDASIGSIWLDTSGTGAIWQRNSVATNTASDWSKIASEEFVRNELATTVSWREPVAVRSTQATLPAAGDNTVDGVTVTDGMRVLFTDPALNNVYIASGSPGNWTWTEDTNAETPGDTVYVESGTDAGKRFTFNTSNAWGVTDQTSLDEHQNIRDFIGKNSIGVESPNYTSTNVVTQGANLETAIGELDTGIQAVDDKIGAPVTAGEVVEPANTVNQNLQAIDTWIDNNGKSITVTGVSSAQVVDTLPTTVTTAKWIVEVSDANGLESAEILAVTNGSLVDHTEYAVVRVGTKFNTKDITVSSSAGGMQLSVASVGRPVTVKVKRVSVI